MINALKEWEFDDKIQGIYFETTMPIIGRQNGTSEILEGITFLGEGITFLKLWQKEHLMWL